ncbi:MAG: type II/IV secretion system protein [Candidatus Nealsonbacteria bacterium]|nr:type II/IV secretion system protein [Candidatus Nealsonbacteria bacterium]
MRVEASQLRAFLLDAGLVTREQFGQALKKASKTNQDVGDILVADKLITEEELIKLQSYILGIPFVDLRKETVPLEILSIIPEPMAKKHSIVAFKKSGNDLEVAMLDPADLRVTEFIKKEIGLRVLPRLTSPEGIKNILKQYQKTLEVEFGEIIKRDAEDVKPIAEERMEEKSELEKIAKELPIVRIVDTLIKHAILGRASDIHIEPQEKEVTVRYRIDGVLHDAMTLPRQVHSGIVARIKVLANLKLDEHRLPQDGRFKIETDEYRYSLRVSVLPVFDGEKIVMRLLSETAKAFTLEELGLQDNALEQIHDNLKKPVGMILVTGPTGSGKTTTLYSMMEILNKPGVNISTVEDPIEYRMPRVNQTQVNPKIGLTFASGLRSLVRQDPNIIMVGEIRDNETAGLAINASLTGHLVLSTLHTNTAAGAIPRLIDMKAEPFLVSSTLNIILAQRLVKRLCQDKEKYFLKEAELKNFAKYFDLATILKILKEKKISKPRQTLKDIPFFRPKSTKTCPEGYKGRIGIYEALSVTETIKRLITQKATSDEIQRQAIKEGMMTMVEDGFIKASQGITSLEEVLRVIIE